jgi:hypothetical protein
MARYSGKKKKKDGATELGTEVTLAEYNNCHRHRYSDTTYTVRMNIMCITLYTYAI